MKQIAVILNVDETTILNESGQKDLDDAISQELNWLHDSGMFLDSWSYTEQQKEKAVPQEFVVLLAHLAGELEAKGQIHSMEWDALKVAINTMVDAYQNDFSESKNPFCLEDAAERYFIVQFGTDQAKKNAIACAAGWQNKTPSELISEAKTESRSAPNISEWERALSGKNNFEYDKVIIRSNDTGELFVVDCINKDDFLRDYADLPSVMKKFQIIGVHTNPECGVASHPCKISALWDEIPSNYQDTPDPVAIADVVPGKEYDVCYYYTEDDKNTLYSGVDLKLGREEILNNIHTNKYLEGATIHESSRILTIEEYQHGMRRSTKECRDMMNEAQLTEVRMGVENGVKLKLLLRPELSPAELRKLRTEIETENARLADPTTLYVATDYGPEELTAGFKSESNFAKYPDRVCYVPDLWDFDIDGPGITGQGILDLCNGDKLKAEMVFDLCEWQHPSTVLSEWYHDDDLALEAKHAELLKRHSHRPNFSDLLSNAKDRVNPAEKLQKEKDVNR